MDHHHHDIYPFGSVEDILGDVVDALRHFGDEGVAYYGEQSATAILDRVSKLDNLSDLKVLTSYIERRLKSLFESRDYLISYRHLKDSGIWKALYHYVNISKSFILSDNFTAEDAVDHKNRSLRLSNTVAMHDSAGISFCFNAVSNGLRERDTSLDQKIHRNIAAFLFASLDSPDQLEVRETILSFRRGVDDLVVDDVKQQTKLAFYNAVL